MTSRQAPLRFLVVTFALVLGACSASGGGASSAPSQVLAVPKSSALANLQPTAVVDSPTPVPTESPTAPASQEADAQASATPGPIDPCTLLTSSEASGFIGATLGAGKRQDVGPDSVCTWSKGATKLKVFLDPSTDPVAAKAYYDSHKSEIPKGAQITELPDLFDGSLIGKGATPLGTIGGIFVLDGGHFFELYCEFPTCSDDSLKSGATLIAGRLP